MHTLFVDARIHFRWDIADFTLGPIMGRPYARTSKTYAKKTQLRAINPLVDPPKIAPNAALFPFFFLFILLFHSLSPSHTDNRTHTSDHQQLRRAPPQVVIQQQVRGVGIQGRHHPEGQHPAEAGCGGGGDLFFGLVLCHIQDYVLIESVLIEKAGACMACMCVWLYTYT